MEGIDWTRTAAQIDAQYRALRAENEALRAALQNITNGPMTTTEAMLIAADALAQIEKEKANGSR